MANAVTRYKKGSYINMIPGTAVFDNMFDSCWIVLANDGQTVSLKNTSGGKNGVEMDVSDATCSETICFTDAVGQKRRYEELLINALERAIDDSSEDATKRMIRAMKITPEELDMIGYDADNFPTMHEWAAENE